MGPRQFAWLLAAILALPAVAPPAAGQDGGRNGGDPGKGEPEKPKETEQQIALARELEKKLDSRNKLDALDAVEALGALRTPTACEVLMKFVRGTSNSEHGARAVRALGWEGNDQAVDFLCGKDGARSSRVLVAEAACRSLADIGNKRAIPSLLEVIKRGKTVAVCAAIEAVVKLDREAKGLADLLSSMAGVKEDTVRVSVADALGYLQGPKVVAALIHLATRDGHSLVRESACRSLGRLAPREAREPLREVAANDKSQEVRSAASDALTRIPADPEPGKGEGR